MESSEVRRRRIKQNRRKERAEKVEKERAPNDPDEDDNEGPPVKKPRKRPRKPTAVEDIVDGFAILAFKNYEDLTRAIRLAEDDSEDRQRICCQLLKRSQEGGDNNKGSSEKEKASPKPSKPRTTSSKKKVKLQENGESMVSKITGSDSKCSAPSSGGGVSMAHAIPNPITIPTPNFHPRPHPPKKSRANGPPSAKEAIHNFICESDETGDKISDGCSDLFAPPRKDSSPHLPDNLISSNEPKGIDPKQNYINHELPKSTSTATTGTSVVNLRLSPALEEIKSKIEHPETSGTITPLHGTNGPLSGNSVGGSVVAGDVNGHNRSTSENSLSQVNEKKFVPSRTGPQTLFTPYATTAITRVSTPVERPPSTSQAIRQPESPKDQSHQPLSLPVQTEPFVSSHPHRINHHNHNHNSIVATNSNSTTTTNISSSLKTSNNIASNSSNITNSNGGNILTIPTPNAPHNHSSNNTYATLSTSHLQRSSPTVDNSTKAGAEQPASGRGVLTPPLANQLLNRKSHTPSGKVTPTTNKSAAFGSIARLLDSPTTSAQSRNSPTVNATVTASTNHHSPNNIVSNHPLHQQHSSHPNQHSHHPHHPHHHHHHQQQQQQQQQLQQHQQHQQQQQQPQQHHHPQLHPHSQPSNHSQHHHHHHHQQSSTGAPAISSNSSSNPFGPGPPHSCSSRSHSPRGHSPSRERDSYSSNVSSLSRTSVTPVSGSQSSQLPPNLSPLQNLSYSKAASWLSSVPGLSPVPRPTPPPPPPSSHPSVQGNIVSGGGPLSLSTGPPSNPFSGYSQASHLPPSHSAAAAAAAAMFAPPILPLSSITQHPSSQPSPFGPSTDSIFHSASSSELVRRDLESRFLASDRNAATGGPSSFITRPGDLHPHHHPLLPPLSGVNHLQSHNPGGPNSGPPSHSALFPPPLFKDLSKVGLESPFYRANLGMSYPGFNGVLPPHNLPTPFAPPSQLAAFTPKTTDACKPAKVMKSGRWNAMHVRIAWEIYQHQQKGGGPLPEGGKGGSSNNSSLSSSKNSLPSSVSGPPNLSSAGIPPSPQQQASSSLAADLLRTSNHVFAGLSRPPDVGGGGPFGSPLLSPHAPPPPQTHRGTPFDSSHSIFLNSAPHNLGPPMPRYPGFGGLGPTFSGLSSLGSSLLGRDLSSLAALGPSQEQWQRLHRGQPFSAASGPMGVAWPLQRPERDVKTPTESRRHKDERSLDKRHEPSYLSDNSKIGGGNPRDASPFRDRSPVRPARTPLENGDTDSRSSRSSDSHSTVHPPSSKSISRLKDEAANGERDKSSTPLMSYDRDKISHPGIMNDINKAPTHMASSHPSRLFHPSSPLGVPISTAWDTFPGVVGAGPRMSSAESFRLSLLQLSERERELSRVPPHQATMRPPFFPNGPFGNLPLGSMGVGPPPPGSTGSSNSSKSSPSSGPIPLLNPSPSPAHMHGHSLSHHLTSQNGPNSPNKLEDQPPSSSSSRSKEESHQSR